MAVTIKDIAKQAGVSHTTVSRALHGNALISYETAQRIRQLAVDMGYQPSAAARSLKTNRSQVLGVIVSSLDDPFFSEILQGIEDCVQEGGYNLFIAASQHDPQREQKIVQTLMEHRVDGVIICSTPFSPTQGRHLLDYGFPIVVVNNQSAEGFRYSIYHDDVDGSRQMTRHLVALGHRRIAYLGNSLSGRTTLDRLSGFRQEMQAADLPVPAEYVHQVAGGSPAQGLAGAVYFLGLPLKPTAVVCFNDQLATGMLKGLRLAGLDVPADLSVTGFDNITFSAYTHPPLTTFDQPKRYIGMEAARLLLGLLRHEPEPGEKVMTLQGSLLVRASTAAPPKGIL
jgi:LacI family transcriptional regulator/LacI family repressor for deo operon, udp, cdd, tsx, nupC, and nupG